MADEASDDTATRGDAANRGELAQIDFSTFVLSLATTALLQLGLAPNPEDGQRSQPNRLLARQTIDTLEMLRTKTRGNLEDDERKLLDSLLYELRMRYVEAGK